MIRGWVKYYPQTGGHGSETETDGKGSSLQLGMYDSPNGAFGWENCIPNLCARAVRCDAGSLLCWLSHALLFLLLFSSLLQPKVSIGLTSNCKRKSPSCTPPPQEAPMHGSKLTPHQAQVAVLISSGHLAPAKAVLYQSSSHSPSSPNPETPRNL